MIHRVRIVALALVALSLLMAFPALPVSAFNPRPTGGPYVPFETIRDAFNNVTYYTRNLLDSKVVSYFSSSTISTPNTGSVNTVGLACAMPCSGTIGSAAGTFFTTPSALTPNFVQNPGFETGTFDPWVPTGSTGSCDNGEGATCTISSFSHSGLDSAAITFQPNSPPSSGYVSLMQPSRISSSIWPSSFTGSYNITFFFYVNQNSFGAFQFEVQNRNTCCDDFWDYSMITGRMDFLGQNTCPAQITQFGTPPNANQWVRVSITRSWDGERLQFSPGPSFFISKSACDASGEQVMGLILSASVTTLPSSCIVYFDDVSARAGVNDPNNPGDWTLNSLVFSNLLGTAGLFDGRLVAHVYSLDSSGLPSSSIGFSNTLRVSNSGIGAADGTTYSTFNFTFGQIGKASLQLGTTYFADLELRDFLSAQGSVTFDAYPGNSGMIYASGGWHSFFGPAITIGLLATAHYTVAKEYPAYPLDFVSVHDDNVPVISGSVGTTRSSMALHEAGMGRTFTDCFTNMQDPYTTYSPITGYPYNTIVNNILADQAWSGYAGALLNDDPCPEGLNQQPYISDASFQIAGPESACWFGGLGVNRLLCSFTLNYCMSEPYAQRFDNVYMGASEIVSLSPTACSTFNSRLNSAVTFAPFYQTESGYEAFRYSTRHALQLASKYFGYVLGPHFTAADGYNYTIAANKMVSLLADYGFGPDIYDPLFDADYNLADGYLSDGSSSGPYHDCYVVSQLPGDSFGANSMGSNIGIDYYPYRSGVCSDGTTSLNIYLCYETGCFPFTTPDALFTALHARHLLNKYLAGTDGGSALTSAETDINNICYDGKGVCIGQFFTSYSTVRLATYLAALAVLVRALGSTTTYQISGNGCKSQYNLNCSLTQRMQDVANILWKLQLGAGPWSANQCQYPSNPPMNLPAAFEDSGSNQVLCAANAIGGFMVGYTPGDAPFAFKAPRSAAVSDLETFYCAIVTFGGDLNCVNMPAETPFPTPTNAETTIVSMMALLDYYKQVYRADSIVQGSATVGTLIYCSHHFGASTGGSGLAAFSAVRSGYLFMCDQKDFGKIDGGNIVVQMQNYGANYAAWNFIVNGGFEAGNLNGWTISGDPTELNVLYFTASPIPPNEGSFLLKMDNHVDNGPSIVQTAPNPPIVYGPFAASAAFYIPSATDLSTASAFPVLTVTIGVWTFYIQPSSVQLGSTLYDCVVAVDTTVSGSSTTLCSSTFISINRWNPISISRDSSGNVFMQFEGVLITTVSDPAAVSASATVQMAKCTSIYFSSFSCSGTTADLYYVDSIKLVQDQ